MATALENVTVRVTHGKIVLGVEQVDGRPLATEALLGETFRTTQAQADHFVACGAAEIVKPDTSTPKA